MCLKTSCVLLYNWHDFSAVDTCSRWLIIFKIYFKNSFFEHFLLETSDKPKSALVSETLITVVNLYILYDGMYTLLNNN